MQATASPPMKIHRAIVRRQLDIRLGGLEEVIGACPPLGWITTIRRAIGMSTGELARRMAISQQRASQLERAEMQGSVRLSTLRGVAAALNCQLLYVFVPNEPLEDMVRQQARRKAAEEVAQGFRGVRPEDEVFVARLIDEELDARALELVDKQGLWL